MINKLWMKSEKSTTMGTEKGYRSYQTLILNAEQLLSSTPAQPEAPVSVLFYQGSKYSDKCTFNYSILSSSSL